MTGENRQGTQHNGGVISWQSLTVKPAIGLVETFNKSHSLNDSRKIRRISGQEQSLNRQCGNRRAGLRNPASVFALIGKKITKPFIQKWISLIERLIVRCGQSLSRANHDKASHQKNCEEGFNF